MLRTVPYLTLWCLVLNGCDSSPQEDTTPLDQAVFDSTVLDQGLASDMMTTSDAGPDAVVDMGPDARIPLMPDELPTEGSLIDPPEADLREPVTAGVARAGQVHSDEERLTGPEANCRIGDFRLDNALVSICIQAETTFSQFSFAGGNIIDAHRADRPTSN